MSVCARENTVAIVHAQQQTHIMTHYNKTNYSKWGSYIPMSEGVGEGDVSSRCLTSVGLGVGGISGDMTFKRGCSEPVGEIVL